MLVNNADRIDTVEQPLTQKLLVSTSFCVLNDEMQIFEQRFLVLFH